MSSPSPESSPATDTNASPPLTNSTVSPPAPSATAPPPSLPVSPPPTTSSAPPPAAASSSNSTLSPPPPTTPASAPPPPTTPASAPPPSPSVPGSSPPPSSPAPPPSSSAPPPPSVVKNSPPPPSSSGSTSPPSSSSGNKTSHSSGSASQPPPSKSSSSSSSPPPPPSSSSTISTGIVVGIAIGGVVILLVLSIMFLCCCKKRKKRYNGPSDYYPPPPPLGSKADPYSVQQQHWQHNAPPPSYPPSTASSVPSQPPPYSPLLPPPFTNNSSGSGSNNCSVLEAPPPSPGMGLAFAKSSFTYEELAMATNGFSDANLLGQGGFGYVHKGVLPTGKEIAVKQLKIGSGQGEREFQAEVEIISRVHHRHLVSLVGYCITGSQRLLVYEFVPNGTLEFHLHGKGRRTMDWSLRLKIALGSAKGLAYLHEDCHPKIIHRDIKAANILLDSKFEAMVADFGLAKFTPDLNTHVSTRVMGTFGYLAPEYASSGKLSDKSDVFSFGVMLLELITGRRPVDSNNTYMDDSLVDWARPYLTRALEDGILDALADPRLQNEYKPNEMTRMIACAAACVRHSARRRPRMSQIVRALEGDVSLSDLNEGIRPGHSMVHGSSHEGSSDYDTSQYNEDMKKFRKMALASQEYGSSDYSAGVPTSEYGMNPSGSSTESQRTTREFEMRKPKSKDTTTKTRVSYN